MATRGKRKKAKPKISNPLFCGWLQEWKDEAETNGWKSVYTYGMALSSLKKYPLRLDRGKDCKILMHFGDKICGMLDKKLEEYIASGGCLNMSDSEGEEPESRPRRKAATGGRKAQPTDTLPGTLIQSDTDSGRTKARRSSSSGRPYIPAYRSGPYAIILTLHQYTQVDRRAEYLTKKDLTTLAQPFCDKSLTVPDVGSYYTAFSSMSNLISKGLVDKHSSPARYRLTNEGVILAQTLVSQGPSASTIGAVTPASSPSTSANNPRLPDVTSHTATSNKQGTAAASKAKTGRGKKAKPSNTYNIQGDIRPPDATSCDDSRQRVGGSSTTLPTVTTSISATEPAVAPDIPATPLFTLLPSQYEVTLIVDNREHFGFGNAKQQILPSLVKNAVKFDVRPINVGDFVWVAKERYGVREVVLDFIVERKRLDDLSGSMVDGRYKEQKLRMKQSGLRKPIYLIEYHKTQENEKIKEDVLHQAVMNTQIIDGFYVKRCDNIKDSIAYLTLLHNQIIKLYQGKTIHAYTQESLPELPFNPGDAEMCHMTYGDFNMAGVRSKPPTVSESWRRMLMCIPGVSLDKACVIVENYPTLSRLVDAYRRCDSDTERLKLLRNFKSGPTERRIGDVVSRNICTLFFSSQPLP